MKNPLIHLFAVAVCVFALPACASTTSPGTSTLSSSKTKPYPLKTCIVSDNELGSMGKIITKTHEGQEVKFCCKPCVKKFDADPAKYIAKLK